MILWAYARLSRCFFLVICFVAHIFGFLISLFLVFADFVYFLSLSFPDSMISLVSMARRSGVVVSFVFGVFFFREKNIKDKAIDLILVLIGMYFLYLGSR